MYKVIFFSFFKPAREGADCCNKWFRGKECWKKMFPKDSGVATGKRIKDLKIWPTTDHNKKKKSAMSQSFGFKKICSLFCLVKQLGKNKTKPQKTNKRTLYFTKLHSFHSNNFLNVQEAMPGTAQTLQGKVLIFTNLCKQKYTKQIKLTLHIGLSCVSLEVWESLIFCNKHTFSF